MLIAIRFSPNSPPKSAIFRPFSAPKITEIPRSKSPIYCVRYSYADITISLLSHFILRFFNLNRNFSTQKWTKINVQKRVFTFGVWEKHEKTKNMQNHRIFLVAA